MFQFQEVVDSLKGLASNDPTPGVSHCKLLETYAKTLGYQSYYHFVESLKHLPNEQFANVSLKLMRQICLKRIPSQDCAYFEFQAFSSGKIGFYSAWAGWDKRGDEVRVPRELAGPETAIGLRELATYPIYVVQSSNELLAWRYNWRSTALIPENLAKEFFAFAFNKRRLVENNPPMDLVRAKASRYENNIAYAD
jgi:hypothetical protein